MSKFYNKEHHEPMTAVLWGHSAPAALYAQVLDHINTRIGTVKTGRLYVLKEICGEQFWEQELRTPWRKRMAGKCFAHMVHYSIFKLESVRHKKYSTIRYLLR